MKRYWKMISLCLVAVVVLGSFYTHISMAEATTKIEFEKISGNEEEVDPLSIYGTYGGNGKWESLEFTKEETMVLDHRGLTAELTMRNDGPLQGMVDKHKSFMRGKNISGYNFYEDEEMIVYAGVKGKNVFADELSETELTVDILNKKDKSTKSTDLTIMENQAYGWVDVVEVQVFGNELKVYLRAFTQQGVSDLVVYRFDLANLKVLGNESITATPVVENGWADLQILTRMYSTDSERYLLMKFNRYSENSGDDMGAQLVENHQVIIYDMEKNKELNLTVPESLVIDLAAVEGATIYFPSQTANGLEILPYDIEKGEWGKAKSFAYFEDKGDEEYPTLKLLNGKIYQFGRKGNENRLVIGDLTTGKTLYEGKLIVVGDEDGVLEVHEVEVME